jgi:alpha-tubulin suppressor-like RCC1 family protein
MRRAFASLSLLLIAILATTHCGAGAPSGPMHGNEKTGSISLEISTVPTGVQCIQISALGSSLVTQNFTVTAGSSSAGLTLGQLPLGQVTITGQAFTAACTSLSGQTAAWVADTAVVTLQAGVTASLTLTFRPNNSVSGSASFVGNITQIALGDDELALVFSDGSVRGAGDWPLNQATVSLTSPVTLTGLTNVARLAPNALETNAISDTNCILLKSGTLQCWGDNTYGQYGSGATGNGGLTPTTVTIPGSPTIAQVGVGQGHVCVATATDSNGHISLYCWGRNDHFQTCAGNSGSSTNILTPTRVGSNLQPGPLVVGPQQTCLGTACCGLDANGQLGTGGTADVQGLGSTLISNATTQIAFGNAHACGVRADGNLFCWGANGSGQLGIGNTTEQHSPTQVTAISGVLQVAAAANSTCALRSDRSVWCWGDGTAGAVGDGSGTVVLSPTATLGLPPSAAIYGSSGHAVTPGGSYCSASTNQSIWCWGVNNVGQLANGSFDTEWVPTPLSL